MHLGLMLYVHIYMLECVGPGSSLNPIVMLLSKVGAYQNEAPCYETFYIFSNKLECFGLGSYLQRVRLEHTQRMHLAKNFLQTCNKLNHFGPGRLLHLILMLASKVGAYPNDAPRYKTFYIFVKLECLSLKAFLA